MKYNCMCSIEMEKANANDEITAPITPICLGPNKLTRILPIMQKAYCIPTELLPIQAILEIN